MDDIRCGACTRKLGEGQYTRLNIKCPRCGALNTLRAMSPEPERPRASKEESAMNGTQERNNGNSTYPGQRPQTHGGQPVRRNRGL